MPKDKKDDKEPKKESSKALSWRERMDPEAAGGRWDSDVQEGMGKWKGTS